MRYFLRIKVATGSFSCSPSDLNSSQLTTLLWGQADFLFLVAQHSRPPFRCWGFEVTLRHTILGRIPLPEGSIRRRDLYLTTDNIHKRQTSVPLSEFEPAAPVAAYVSLRSRGHRDGLPNKLLPKLRALALIRNQNSASLVQCADNFVCTFSHIRPSVNRHSALSDEAVGVG
jgi:hypothetical protein